MSAGLEQPNPEKDPAAGSGAEQASETDNPLAVSSLDGDRARLAFELEEMQHEVEPIMRDFGLDFYTQVFEIVTPQQMNVIAARDGFPVRYPHWKWGMGYEEFASMGTAGLQKLYELVINNDPCYAYMLETNSSSDNRLVMAHVYAHNDFFKNNLYFAHTNRQMLEQMGSHAARIRRYMRDYGQDRVERFIDSCLSIDDLIDVHSTFFTRRDETRHSVLDEQKVERPPRAQRIPAQDEYMDEFLNPADAMAREQERLNAEFQHRKRSFPEQPERDVMKFVIDHASRLEPWQRDILSMIREEAYYFAPQMMTKIMNEGWASYWHSEGMTQKLLPQHPEEIVDYAQTTAGVWRQGRQQLNPYRLGLKIFRDIKERWDKGQFGEEWERCSNRAERASWDKELGLGTEKIFEVRKIHNDVTFIENFLTPELCVREKLFVHEGDDEYREISSRDFEEIKRNLIKGLVNGGRPILEVIDGNFDNHGELLIEHKHDGKDLDLDYAKRTMKHLSKIWGRPVHVRTQIDDEWTLFTHDGNEFSTREA